MKPNAQVMHTKNEVGGILVNGLRGVVIGFTNITTENKDYEELKDKDYEIITESCNCNYLPVDCFLNGKGKIVYEEEFLYRANGIRYCMRTQIPLKLAWAITIHKS